MCRFQSQHWCLIIAVCLLMFASGCRNRGPFTARNGAFSPLGGPTTVAPPNTYSLQIPGNNYNGSGTVQQLPVHQATNTLPGNQRVNVQNGWQPLGASQNQTNAGNQTGPVNNSTSQLQNTNSTIASRTQVVSVTPPRQNQIQNVSNIGSQRVAQNTNSGLSFTDTTNFRTTAVDERLDDSRLPVTDASQVRAPTSSLPTTSVGQLNLPYYVPNQQPVRNLAPQYQNAQPRFATNPQYQQPQYVNPNLANNQQNTVIGRFGVPTFAQPSQQVYSGLATQNRQVLGQSTVYADPTADPNFQSGWRNPELTASRGSLNR